MNEYTFCNYSIFESVNAVRLFCEYQRRKERGIVGENHTFPAVEVKFICNWYVRSKVQKKIIGRV